LKDEADKVFNALGMNLTTAITVFVKQAVRQKKIPFEISLYADERKDVSRREAAEVPERILPFVVTDYSSRKTARERMRDAFKIAQEDSVANGTDGMTMDEINAVIEECRRERRAERI
jgi:addiction module RelB/DinJ family antitoxin